MPGLAFKQSVIARIGYGEVFVEVWPSKPPEHLGDVVTLTLTVDGVVMEEVGRFASYDAAMRAGQSYFDDRGGAAPPRPLTGWHPVLGRSARPRAGCSLRPGDGLLYGRTKDYGRPILNLV
jgi:hypothetical protein